MFGLIEDKKYDVWYLTPKKMTKKRKSFDTIEEATKWCKLNKNRIKLREGSWQVLNIMTEIQTGKKVEYDNSDCVWRFGRGNVNNG